MSTSAVPVVLVVDDERGIRESVRISLQQEGISVLVAHDAPSTLRIFQESIVDALILDIRLGAFNGITLFQTLQAKGLAPPTIFISGEATLTEAAQAVRLGAFDFIEKPFSSEKLAISVRRCLEHASLTERLRLVESQNPTIEVIGDSAAIQHVVASALKVAPTDASVLIQGESGTGKELVANTIHQHSARSAKPFVKVNCSAIPENLVESELFGYERGAFSGAITSKKGLFEAANRGTMFLDEVADLSLAAQAKMLRVLQSGEIQKVGGANTIKVDVRVLSATHKDLRQCVSEGSFREDLFYRLNVVPLTVPSLRERPEDIPLLVRFMVRKLCEKNNLKEKEIDDEVLEKLKEYSWPGNVRELQNVLERMLILSGQRMTLEDIPTDLDFSGVPESRGAERASLNVYRNNAEREFIVAALKRNAGNVTRAAAELGIRRTYLYRRLAILGIDKRGS